MAMMRPSSVPRRPATSASTDAGNAEACWTMSSGTRAKSRRIAGEDERLCMRSSVHLGARVAAFRKPPIQPRKDAARVLLEDGLPRRRGQIAHLIDVALRVVE